MKSSLWRHLIGAGLLSVFTALPAFAAPVTFEDVTPTMFSGDSVQSGGFAFTSDGNGFSGVDGVDALFAPPAGASGQFLYMLNNDGMRIRSADNRGFYLSGFDTAFLAPIPGEAGVLAGRLSVDLFDHLGALIGTEVFDFALGEPGSDFPFASFSLSSTAQLAQLSQAYFYACAFQAESGECVNGDDLPAQFALDNLGLEVPEPASLALVLGALGVLALSRRPARKV